MLGVRSERNMKDDFFAVEPIMCQICWTKSAKVRECERNCAIITHRAHVDCIQGHSEYRPLFGKEIPNKEGTR